MDTELVLVGGITEDGVAEAVRRLLRVPGTAVLHHDLTDVISGVVRRRLRVSGRGLPGDRPGGGEWGGPGVGVVVTDHTEVLELAHGCVSCTLREDVLPLVRALARRPGIGRIVLHLDPVLEPEQVCWAVLHVLVDGATVADEVTMGGVITVLDPATWLADAVSERDVSDRGFAALPDDERTVAQVAVAQAEFADLLVYAGSGRADGTDGGQQWVRARTDAVLARLTPLAPRLELAALDPARPLAGVPDGARRGLPDSPHAVLLRGQPPLGEDCGVRLMMFTARRPFHPERLHEAMDLLLDGVVRAKGRIWLATRPEAVLWMESAGGGLEVGYVDNWLAAQDDAAWAAADPERRAAAALRWQPRYGDRVQELAVLTCGADPEEIEQGLRGALLTDAEVIGGEDEWRRYPDPFGWHHTDPCGEPQPVAIPTMPPLAGGPAPDRRRSTEDDARRPDPHRPDPHRPDPHRPGEPGPSRSREDES